MALILLFALLALPFLLYFLPNSWWRGDSGQGPPQLVVEWITGGKENGAVPTGGMSIGPQGFGTVTEAPAVLVRKTSEGTSEGIIPESPIAPDISRFLRALPRERLVNPPKDGIMTCNLEGPPHYQGRIVLVDGCLRFHGQGSAKPGPLVLGIDSVHRDAQNYLAVGLRGAAEFEIRVGEPDGVFIGVGCSMDDPVPAPPELARACGIGEMRRLGTIKRKRLCSESELAALARTRAAFEARQNRLRAQHGRCMANGTPAHACPPPDAPPPPELFRPACRTP